MMKKEETNEEKNEEATDLTTEDTSVEESESAETQLNPKHRGVALASLVAGYTLALGFAAVLFLGSDMFLISFLRSMNYRKMKIAILAYT